MSCAPEGETLVALFVMEWFFRIEPSSSALLNSMWSCRLCGRQLFEVLYLK